MTDGRPDGGDDTIEEQWLRRWDRADPPDDPDYVVDTPPPYPTGDLHLGHALNWGYADFAARYHRMRGDDVLFPQGWDCHGLPTEVAVEAAHGIDRTEVDRERFRELCVSHTEDRIESMRESFRRLGISQDWDAEFRTMDPEYRIESQRAFLRMADRGYVYRDEHPVNWCPDCRTAIADAEVETEEGVEGRLHRIRFPASGDDSGAAAIDVATTRPELLPACVAVVVPPDDDRYANHPDALRVPLAERSVPVLSDSDADPDFGTGAVMICTFGDEQDADWWARHDLPLRPVVGPDGALTDIAGEYAGLGLGAAREAIRSDLDEAGLLLDTEPVEQSVGVCWRCDTPVEIRSTEQWFVEARTDEILDCAGDVEWIPDHAHERLTAWAKGMTWDWVVSRQRTFGTPIPAWTCDECGAVRLADEDRLPVDPTADDPRSPCADCGSDAWTGESDVLDTWMDSSITPLYLQGWPEEPFEPVALRPQGSEIIRTWAFYTLLRTAALTGEKPWETALVNGMVLGADGRKMSKSRGNGIAPETAISEFSADTLRLAVAAGGRPGSDVQLGEAELKSASRFRTKVENVAGFAAGVLPDDPLAASEVDLRDADRWILARATTVCETATAAMDDYRYDEALCALREFVWSDLADDYLELVKGRIYDDEPGADAARWTLNRVVSAALRLLAPFAPFRAAEDYRSLPTTPADADVHEAAWPALDWPDGTAARRGELVAAVAAAVRRWKSDRGLALSAPLSGLSVHLDDGALSADAIDTRDLSNATNAPVEVTDETPRLDRVPVGVEIDHGVLGPRFRDRADAVANALRAADPATVAAGLERGAVEVTMDGDPLTVPEAAVSVEYEPRVDGDRVAALDVDGALVVIDA